jgi:ribosomal protein S18 acetylase RimI-like enzyme
MAEISRAVSLRTVSQADEPFMLNLFASTRPEFEILNWDENQRMALMSMQFHAQSQQFRAAHPEADASVILWEHDAVGRMIVDRGAREFLLVDISLLPQHRRLGIGTHLIRNLLHEAAESAKPVRLHVVQTNPAKRLYERLGFSVVSSDSVYCEMICVPGMKMSDTFAKRGSKSDGFLDS